MDNVLAASLPVIRVQMERNNLDHEYQTHAEMESDTERENPSTIFLSHGREIGMFGHFRESFEWVVFRRIALREPGVIGGLWPWTFDRHTCSIHVILFSQASLIAYQNGFLALQNFLVEMSELRMVRNLVLEGFDRSGVDSREASYQNQGYLPCLILQTQLCTWLTDWEQSAVDSHSRVAVVQRLSQKLIDLAIFSSPTHGGSCSLQCLKTGVHRPSLEVNVRGVIVPGGDKVRLDYLFLEKLMRRFKVSAGLRYSQLYRIISLSCRLYTMDVVSVTKLQSFTVFAIQRRLMR